MVPTTIRYRHFRAGPWHPQALFKALTSKNTHNGAVGLPEGCVPAGWTQTVAQCSLNTTQPTSLLLTGEYFGMAAVTCLPDWVLMDWLLMDTVPEFTNDDQVDQATCGLEQASPATDQTILAQPFSLRTATVAADVVRPRVELAKPKQSRRLQHWVCTENTRSSR